jgi:ankyrin repeat protein
MRAAARGETAAVKNLLAKGADPNVASSEQGVTALMFAAYFGHVDIVNALVQKGARVDAKDGGGSGPIDWAAVGGRKEIAKLFSAKGAQLNPNGGGFIGIGSMPLWLMKKAAEKSS